MKKIIALNYKTFPQALGEHALDLSLAARDVAAAQSRVEIIVALPAPELHYVASRASGANFAVFAQHADAREPGQTTGWLPPEALKEAGCAGTLVNHAEKKLAHDELKKIIARAHELGLKTIACADSLKEARELARLKPAPWAIAVEPPELIGTGVSVSSARPEVVKGAVSEIKNINAEIRALVGAGVSNALDFKRSLELGAEGVLLASAFVKSPDPRAFLKSFIEVIA